MAAAAVCPGMATPEIIAQLPHRTACGDSRGGLKKGIEFGFQQAWPDLRCDRVVPCFGSNHRLRNQGDFVLVLTPTHSGDGASQRPSFDMEHIADIRAYGRSGLQASL